VRRFVTVLLLGVCLPTGRAAGTNDLLHAVRTMQLMPADWMAVTIPSAVQVEAGTTPNAVLEGKGWTYRDFNGIRRYFHPPTCGL
jgi:hypothetical protein